jgi:hypothetical protein
MDLPQGNEWIIWIFKFICLGGIVYLSRRFSGELQEASGFFRFDKFIIAAFLITMVGSVVTMIVFYDKRPFELDIITKIINVFFWTFGILIIGRVIYKKFYPTETSE